MPQANAMDDPEVTAFLATHAAAHLVTVGPDGRPDSTLLPVLVDGDRVVGHLARANDHWTRIAPASPGLVVVSGADAYVSPGWYATKAEHGRVVPTWNYSEVQLRGAVTVHDDPDWVLDVVTRLTERHEAGREQPWAVDGCPGEVRPWPPAGHRRHRARRRLGGGQGQAEPEPLRRRPRGRHRRPARRG